LDGFGAGPDQAVAHPLGRGGEALHEWAFATRTFHQMTGRDGGETGIDDDMFAAGRVGVGAWIIGRNMFGPERGPWSADPWRGWWGEDPPFHVPVFVLTRQPREPLVMQGGTVFHFITDRIEAALEQATEAAGGKDVRLGGGVDVIRQYLRAGLIDEMHLAVAPTLIGRGESLFQDLDLPSLGYQVGRAVPGDHATHVFISRSL